MSDQSGDLPPYPGDGKSDQGPATGHHGGPQQGWYQAQPAPASGPGGHGVPAWPLQAEGSGPPSYKGQQWGLPFSGPGSLIGQWWRLLAEILDILLFVVLAVILQEGGVTLIRIRSVKTCSSSGLDCRTVVHSHVHFLAIALLFLASFVYEVVMIAVVGRTLGMMAVGAKPVLIDSPEANLTLGRAALRTVVKRIPGALEAVGPIYTLVDSLFCLFSGGRQCIHDIAAKTCVIRTR